MISVSRQSYTEILRKIFNSLEFSSVLSLHLPFTNLHFSMSRASIPTYKKIKISATNDKVAKVCLY